MFKTSKTSKTSAGDPAGLAGELARGREVDAARRADELARVRAEAGHGRARADVAEQMRAAELARAEREADARAAAQLARMYRRFWSAGERTRIKSQMARSGEARALRLERLRGLNLKVLVPVLLGFAAWSATGVQAGAARLMGVQAGEAMWWVLWVLEPVLIGAVVWVIIARARLAASGGRMDARAEQIAAACLVTSIFLNLIAAVPLTGQDVNGWAVIGSMIAHAVGPVGAAATAHLIGVIDTSISDADPWTDDRGAKVPLLAEMDLRPPAPTGSAPVPGPDDLDLRLPEQPARVLAPGHTPHTRADTGADDAADPHGDPQQTRIVGPRGAAQARTRRPGRSRTDPARQARTWSRSRGRSGQVDRDALVAELAAEILAAGEAGRKWRPRITGPGGLMERTGQSERWCQYLVQDARKTALAGPHTNPHEEAHDDPQHARTGNPHELTHDITHDITHDLDNPHGNPYGMSAVGLNGRTPTP